MKVRVYIDGYNLYYGALKAQFSADIPKEKKRQLKQEKRRLRWLNVLSLVEQFLKSDKTDYTIEKINFYTADVKPLYNGDEAPKRQKEYYKALSTIKELGIFKGNFHQNPVFLPKYPLSKPITTCKVWKTEEKGSDVNLASHLVFDACKDLFDMAVIITNDSDLLEPIKIVNNLKKEFLILCPHKKYCYDFVKTFTNKRLRSIKPNHLKKAQFSDIITDSSGNIIAERPQKWK